MEKHFLIDNPTVSNIVFYPRKTVIPNNLGPNIEVLKFQIHNNVTIGGFFYKYDRFKYFKIYKYEKIFGFESL